MALYLNACRIRNGILSFIAEVGNVCTLARVLLLNFSVFKRQRDGGKGEWWEKERKQVSKQVRFHPSARSEPALSQAEARS